MTYLHLFTPIVKLIGCVCKFGLKGKNINRIGPEDEYAFFSVCHAQAYLYAILDLISLHTTYFDVGEMFTTKTTQNRKYFNSLSLSICLSVSLSLYFSVSLSLSLSVSLFLSYCLCLCLCLSLSRSLCFSLAVSLSLFLSLSLSLSLSLPLPVSASFSVFLSHSLPSHLTVLPSIYLFLPSPAMILLLV